MRARTWRWWLGVGLVGALALAAVGGLAASDLGSRAQIRSSDAALHRVDRQEAGALRRLDRVEAALHAAQRTRDARSATLRKIYLELYLAQGALTSANQSVFTTGVAIDQLNTCLNGVVEALNQLSVGQQAGALSTLGTVQQACSAATKANGA